MGKKILSLCMALTLCLGLLPVTALADAPNGQVIYVGNENVTNGGYWTTDSNGNVTAYTGGGTPTNNYIHYDVANNTLTLHNATIKESVSTGTSTLIAGTAIGVLNKSGDAKLTIKLEGSNAIENVSTGIFVLASSESTGSASLTITGDGILSASSGSNPGIRVQSNTGNGTLAITGAKVTASSSNGGNGVQIRCDDGSDASLTVNDGSLTATGSGTYGAGIRFLFGSSDSSSRTPSLTVSGNAIVRANGSAGGITSNSSTEVCTAAGTGGSGGIVWNGKNGTVYGDVTLQEDLTIGEDESLTLDDGASLNAGGHNVIVDGGTLGAGLEEALGDNVKYPPTITTTTLTDGRVGEPYSASLGADGTAPITWSVSGSLPAGLSLNGNTISGTPTTAGTSTFTVTATNGYGDGDSEALSITINPAALSITTQPINQSVSEGQIATFSVVATGSNLTYQWQQSTDGSTWTNIDGANSATYTIENTTTGMNGYQYCCVVKDGNSNSVTSQAATLTVTAATVPVTGVTLNKTSTSLYVGDTETLTPTITPDNATNKNLTWSSDDTSVATVDASGLVTAVSAGTATITVTTEDGAKTATCTVTVSRYSSGGGPTTYAVTAPDAENGTVRVSPSRASRGTTVTITVTPDEGYELESLTVLDSRDNEIALTDKGDGKYTFTMPSGRVTVEASFAEIAPEPLPFGDVDDGDWFADAVRFVYESGMMNGVSETSFAPHATTSRSMIVTILYRLEGEPVVDYAMDFTDVAGDAYYTEAVCWAASEGIVGGYGGGLFGSDDAVTREQLAVILYRYAVYKGYDVSIGEDTNILSYADFADLSEYAIPAMQWACGAGVITGVTDATLVPQGEATRAQVAAMLMRFVEAIG